MSKFILIKTMLAIAALVVTGVVHPATPEGCADIRCDCGALTASVLKTVCRDRETDLRNRCEQSGAAESGTCGFFGSKANRPASSWLPQQASTAQLNKAKVLNLKWSAALNSVQSRLKNLDEAKGTEASLVVVEDITQLQSAIDDLLSVQKKLAAVLKRASANNALHDSWSQFSLVATSVGKGVSLVRENVRDASVRESLTEAEASSYEQGAYGYSQAERFEDAAKLWKLSAELTADLMADAERRGLKEKVDQYRYQQSTRLHRARENWAKASESP